MGYSSVNAISLALYKGGKLPRAAQSTAGIQEGAGILRRCMGLFAKGKKRTEGKYFNLFLAFFQHWADGKGRRKGSSPLFLSG